MTHRMGSRTSGYGTSIIWDSVVQSLSRNVMRLMMQQHTSLREPDVPPHKEFQSCGNRSIGYTLGEARVMRQSVHSRCFNAPLPLVKWVMLPRGRNAYPTTFHTTRQRPLHCWEDTQKISVGDRSGCIYMGKLNPHWITITVPLTVLNQTLLPLAQFLLGSSKP